MKTYKQPTYLSAADILQRLPLLRQLTASQTVLIKCTPLWEKWMQLNLDNIVHSTVLSHFQNGELTIHCENSIAATQIKQHQQSLLTFFQDNGISQIKQVTVRIANNPNLFKTSSSSQNEHSQKLNNNAADSPNSLDNQALKVLDNDALNSIKVAQRTTKNTSISESLYRLIQTIEKNNNQN